MVRQTRIIFELGDIPAVRVRCLVDEHCRGEVILHLDKDASSPRKIPNACPCCNEKWDTGRRAEAANKLLQAIHQMATWSISSVGLHFEMPDHKDDS